MKLAKVGIEIATWNIKYILNFMFYKDKFFQFIDWLHYRLHTFMVGTQQVF